VGNYALISLKEWLLIPAVGGLALLPGLGFAVLLARRLRSSWPEVLLLSLAMGIAWTSAVASVTHYLGGTLTIVVVSYVAAIALSLVALAMAWRRGAMRGPALEWQGLAVAGVAAAVAAVERPWFYYGSDTFYHLAASRSLLVTDRPLVTDPFYGTATRALDPTSGAWHTVQAIMSRVLDVDLAMLYMPLTALGAAVLLLGFWCLARRVSDSAWAATLASALYLAGAWGLDLRAMAYPKHFSVGLALLTVLLLIRVMDHPRAVFVAVAVLAGFATVTTHLGSAQLVLLVGVFLIGAVVIVRLFARSQGADWGRPQLRALTAAFGLSILLAVPVLLSKTGALAGTSVIASPGDVDLVQGTIRFGGLMLVRPGYLMSLEAWFWIPTAAVLFFMLVAALAERRSHTIAGAALVSMPFVLLFFPVVSTIGLTYAPYVVSRISELLRFVPFIAAAWALSRVRYREGRFERPAVAWSAAALVGVLTVASVPLVLGNIGSRYGVKRRGYIYTFAQSQAGDLRRIWGNDTFRQVTAVFAGKYPVVAADPFTGYHLAAFVPMAVVALPRSHSPVSVEKVDGFARREAMAAFLDPVASEATRRAIVERWGISFVALAGTPEERAARASMLAQPALFEVAFAGPRLTILRVLTH
jgi:hypothetical protein